MRRIFPVFLLLIVAVPVCADGLADNDTDNVRRLPKLGIEVPAERQSELEAGLAKLGLVIDGLRQRNDAVIRDLLPDVEIYYKAVHDALAYQEFHQAKELDDAVKLLAVGQERAEQLAAGKSPWTTASGLVVRGYVSKIDGSVQPYGLVVPASYTDKGPGSFRCDIWFHGRGETLTELNFIRDRSANPGTFTPKDTLVLHPYGRWNNAFKFAGEVDVLEALESVQRRYRVDDDRISVRGFSMGGAAAWHFAVHYPDRWFAANPGAGFSETPEFLRIFQKEDLKPTPWEKKLWHLYDCPDWVANLKNCPTVAYSGDQDSQKQAADEMEYAMEKLGMHLMHIIGPETKHSYHLDSRREVDERLQRLARRGRGMSMPEPFVTYTLRYSRFRNAVIEGMDEHWSPASLSDLSFAYGMVVTKNVTDFSIDVPPGEFIHQSIYPDKLHVLVRIDAQDLKVPGPKSDRTWQASFHRVDGKWRLGKRPETGLRKKPGLQGPIDDAFMDSFLFVRPTGKPRHELPGKWAAAELTRAIEQWRRHFRGEARVKDDTQVTDADIAGANLVLWGDPQSNSVFARIADKLPIRWDGESIVVRNEKHSADTHALIAIYPNPLNPQRYVVLNSGFTYREYAHLNNARQVPMLPDWAVIDLRTPPGNIWPGKVVDAEFFDEQWQVKPGPRSQP